MEMNTMGGEQKVLAIPGGKIERKYDWTKISPENKARIKDGKKALETPDLDEMNAIEVVGEYYYDRYSDTRGKFLLIRRERRGA
jgi:hypothetical protein